MRALQRVRALTRKQARARILRGLGCHPVLSCCLTPTHIFTLNPKP